MKTSYLFTCLAWAALCTARLENRATPTSHSVQPPKQSSSPKQCDSPCDEIANTNKACNNDPACVCTRTLINGLAVCLQCQIDFGNKTAAEISAMQHQIDQVTSTCDTDGFSVPQESLLPPNASSGASPSASATNPFSQPITPNGGSVGGGPTSSDKPIFTAPSAAPEPSPTSPTAPPNPAPTNNSAHRVNDVQGLLWAVILTVIGIITTFA